MNKYQKKIYQIFKDKTKLNRYVVSDAVYSISYRHARKIIKDTIKADGFWML